MMMNDESLIEWAGSWVDNGPRGQRERFVDGLRAELAARAARGSDVEGMKNALAVVVDLKARMVGGPTGSLREIFHAAYGTVEDALREKIALAEAVTPPGSADK